MKSIILLFLIINTSFCTLNTGETKSNNPQISYFIDMQMVHTFKSKDGNVLGNVYVKPLNGDIFSSLIIAKTEKGKTDTLYFINRTKLINAKKVVETKVLEKGFYGYKIVLKKDTYIVLTALGNNGKDVSDDITIEWNQTEHKFELQKTP